MVRYLGWCKGEGISNEGNKEKRQTWEMFLGPKKDENWKFNISSNDRWLTGGRKASGSPRASSESSEGSDCWTAERAHWPPPDPCTPISSTSRTVFCCLKCLAGSQPEESLVLRQNCLSTLGIHLHTPWIHMRVWEGSSRHHRDASEDKVEEEVLHWATSHQSLRAEGHIDAEQLLPDWFSFSLGPPGSMHNVHVSVTWQADIDFFFRVLLPSYSCIIFFFLKNSTMLGEKFISFPFTLLVGFLPGNYRRIAYRSILYQGEVG